MPEARPWPPAEETTDPLRRTERSEVHQTSVRRSLLGLRRPRPLLPEHASRQGGMQRFFAGDREEFHRLFGRDQARSRSIAAQLSWGKPAGPAAIFRTKNPWKPTSQ